ncbi:hypothetical protein [Winogradskyella wichelsiae]|uniref:hypothetical protein n=1 Tax=Winogradskyella wichelsiae TaxID=2697007 RepID=UPI003EF18A43
MIVYYFGADSAWEHQSETDINRRNMAVLLAIAEQPNVTVVYNIIRCTRALLFNTKQQKKSSHPQIKNVYIAIVLPERGLLKILSKPLNRLILNFFTPKKDQTHNTLSWCYWPKGYEDYKFLGLNNPMIFDTDHNIIDDPNLAEHQKVDRAQLLIEAGKKAVTILSSSRSMISWYNTKGFSTTKILMNGVFKKRINISTKQKSSNTYQVTYCGTLSKWVKVDWILKMAQDQPNWVINIIGRNYKSELTSHLESFENIKMHGYLKPKAVDAILEHTNVCIGLYKEEDALDVNSMKLYDYLAKDLPVVVNKYHENLENDFKDCIKVVDNYTDFIKNVKEIKPNDKGKLSRFLNSVTWQNRVKPLINLVDAS